jgi:hypothetical protein
MWRFGLDRGGSRQGQVAGTCECGNEPDGTLRDVFIIRSALRG